MMTINEAFGREQNISGSQISERRFQLDHDLICLQIHHPTLAHTSLSRFHPFRTIYKDIIAPIESKYDEPEFPDGTLKIPLFYVQNTIFRRISTSSLPPIGMGISIVSLLFVLRSGSTLLRVSHLFDESIQ